MQIIQTEAGNATIGSGERHDDGYDDDAGSDISLLPLKNKGIHFEGLFLNLDRMRRGVAVTAEIMAGQARVIQAEAGNTTIWGNKRHLNGDNINDTGWDKTPPSFNDRAIDAGEIFINLDLQRVGGSQRPLKNPCHEDTFLENYAPLFHTEPYRSEKDQRGKDMMARNRCDEYIMLPIEPSPLSTKGTYWIYTTRGTFRTVFRGQSRI